MWRIRATRERAELVVEPRVVPNGGVLLLLRFLLTVGRRRGVEDGAKNEGDGEDKPIPTVPIKGGDDVGVARRGMIPSCCCGGVDMGDGDDGENKPTLVTPMEGGVPSLDMKPAHRKL